MKPKLNKKGFTLVELLAVIAILMILVGIAFPSILNLSARSTDKVTETQKKEFISLAKLLGNDYKSSLSNTDECYFLSLKDMVENDLLAEIPTDTDGNLYDENSGVKICGGSPINYEYLNSNEGLTSIYNLTPNEVVYDEFTIPSTGGSSGTGSDGTEQIYQQIGQDTSGANKPEFSNLSIDNSENIVPVIYDETCDFNKGCWRVADTSKNWYNYSKGIWANIIVLKTTGSYCDRNTTQACFDTLYKHSASFYKANPGTRISVDDIQRMLVWIPRFKEISTVEEGDHLKTDIQFRSVSEDAHPAFTYEKVNSSSNITTKESNGFWVYKFENEGRPFEVEQQLYTANVNLSPGGPLVDHVSDYMITNYQWGAITMLALSNYGISTNSSCNNKILPTASSIKKGKNKKSIVSSGLIGGSEGDSTYTTYDGRFIEISSNGTLSSMQYLSSATNYGQILGDASSDRNKGYCGSTSGTVYGVYDMVGGYPEHVFLTMNSETNSGAVTPAYRSPVAGINRAKYCSGSTVGSSSSNKSSPRFLYSKQNRYNYNTSANNDNSKNGDTMSGLYVKYASISEYPYCSEPYDTSVVNNPESRVAVQRGKNTIFDFESTDGMDNNTTTRDVWFNE